MLMTRPFVPSSLPREDLDWAALVPLIGRANRALARYDGLVQALVNPDILLAPLGQREAVLSSRIEGTQASLREVLEFEADPREGAGARYEDILEVINYRRAMAAAVEELKSRPLSLNLIKRAHFLLLDSVRGRDKRRGEFRRGQVHIGTPGTPIGVPP
jgi:Fic family protein